MELSARFRKNHHVVVRQIADETLLVPIRGKLADMQVLFVLEGVGEYIGQTLAASPALSAIRDQIARRFAVTPEQAEADLRDFVQELLEAQLIEPIEVP